MYKLAVIPSDPIEAYEEKGISCRLEDYYNPLRFFDKVYCLSPLEKSERTAYGMRIIPTKDKELRKRIKTLGVDIVRAYGGYWPCDMACNYKAEGVPVVVSIHDRRPSWLHDTIKKADAVLGVSEDVVDLVSSMRGGRENVWLLPNRVDMQVMKPVPGERYSRLNGKYPFRYKVLQVGRKSEEKNLEGIISALSYLGGEYCLVAVGGGDTARYLEQAEREGVSGRCFFVDRVDNRELADYFSWADCVCNPSSTEAMSSALIEAMACGTAIVTSEVAARGIGMKNGEDSLVLSEYNDPEKIAEGIRRICGNPEFKNKLKNGALKSVKKYDKVKIDRLETEYYRRVLSMKESGQLKKNRVNAIFQIVKQRILNVSHGKRI